MDTNTMERPNTIQTSNDFKMRIEKMVASGALSFSLAIGIQLGIFEAMEGLKTAASPAYIAKTVGCNDRFLREWLFHMVVGGIVETDATGSRYSLPSHRAQVLLSGGAADLTTFLPAMGFMHGELLKSFKTGNTQGAIFRLPETAFYKRWEQRKEEACHKLIDVLIKHVPDLQGGLEHGINVLDVGCGRGHFLFEMAKQYPGSLFTGIDINGQLIMEARDRAREDMLQDQSRTNVGFAEYDAAILPTEWTGRFDVVMMHEVIYDVPSAIDVLQEVREVLKPGGLIAMVETSIMADPADNLGEHAKQVTAAVAPIISMSYHLPVAMSQPAEEDAEAITLCSGREKLIEVIEEAYFVDVKTYEYTTDNQTVQVLIVAKNE